MDRKALRDRLIAAEFPEEIADDYLAHVKDEDLVRMKDMSPDALLQTIKDSLAEMGEEDNADDSSDTEKDEAVSSAEALVEVFDSMGDNIVAQVKEYFKEMSIEVEVPNIDKILEEVNSLKDSMAAMSQELKDMQESWNVLMQGDKDRLKDILGNMSAASRNRLRLTLTDKEATDKEVEDLKGPRAKERSNIFRPGIQSDFKPTVIDTDGREYENLGDMFHGKPIEAE